ncbi:MAG TPA: hypothetical protein PLV25_06635, partial [Opitutales bacterium]|nr:hypothetical protein [Opitutales bacterium]
MDSKPLPPSNIANLKNAQNLEGKYLVKDDQGWALSSRTWGERAVAYLPNGLKGGVVERFLKF